MNSPPHPPIPGYLDWAVIGAGGFSTVYRARRGGEDVAIKVVRPAFAGRFENECRVLRALTGPFVPELLDTGVASTGEPYLVQRLLRGATLAVHLASEPLLGKSRACLQLMVSLARAIDAVHEAGFVHRDLKPENVVVLDDHASIIDFGIARPIEGHAMGECVRGHTRTGAAVGSVVYMSPEQSRGGLVGREADLYAFGVLLFEMLGGRPPFWGNVAAIERGHFLLRPPALADELAVSPELDAVMHRCLAKRPEDRYPSGQAMVAAVIEALRSSAEPATSKMSVLAPVDVGASQAAMAVLFLDSPLEISELERECARSGAVLVRVHRGGYIVAFPRSATIGAGVLDALAFLGAISEIACAAVHVAEVKVRWRAGRIRLRGSAVDQPDTWMSQRRDHGQTLATAAAVPFIPETNILEQPGSAEARLVLRPEVCAPDPASVALRGREEELQQTLAEMRKCLELDVTAVTMVVGERGGGKTRFIECVASVARTFSAVNVVEIDGGSNSDIYSAFLNALGQEPATHLAGARSPTEERARRARAVSDALALAVRQAPCALLIDDADMIALEVVDGIRAFIQSANSGLWLCIAGGEATGTQWRLASLGREVASVRLRPLDEAECRSLLEELLAPVEHLPHQVFQRIHEFSAGVPQTIVSVAQRLWAAGAVRRRAGTKSWYVTEDSLQAVLRRGAAARQHDSEVDGWPEEIVRATEVAALLDTLPNARDFDAVVSALPGTFGLSHLDSGQLLWRLVEAGILVQDDTGSFRFRRSAHRIEMERRVLDERARLVYAVAWAQFEDRADVSSALRARYAAGCGQREIAATLYIRAAEQSLHEARYADAEAHFTAAIGQAEDSSHSLMLRALRGRGRARYAIERPQDALADFDDAAQLARDADDEYACADIHLDQAEVLDWLMRVEESARAAQEAAGISARIDDSRLRGRVQAAEGRSLLRRGDTAEGISRLRAACSTAALCGDRETQIVCYVMLGPALVFADEVAEAEEAFEKAIQLCLKTNDRFHLGTAYGNRVLLWTRLRAHARAIDDVERALALAREFGASFLELLALHNSAELLFWTGRSGPALQRAIAAFEMDARVRPDPTPDSALLVARIHIAEGRREHARTVLEAATQGRLLNRFTPLHRVLARYIDLCIRDAVDSQEWTELDISAERILPLDERLEVLHGIISQLIHRGNLGLAESFLAEAELLTANEPAWQPQTAALRERLRGVGA